MRQVMQTLHIHEGRIKMTQHDVTIEEGGYRIDIDVYPNNTRLAVDVGTKEVSIVLSNDFVEKLAALIVLKRMHADKEFASQASKDDLTLKITELKKEVQDKFGKAIMDGFK